MPTGRAALLAFLALVVTANAGAPTRRTLSPPASTSILWEVPWHPQSTSYSCGPAALKSALAYYGVFLSEEDILKQVGTTAQNGTEMEPMAALAEKYGLKAAVRTELNLADLEKQLAAKQLTIVTLQAYRDTDPPEIPYRDVWDSGHYVIVVGMDAENLYFVDPNLDGHRGFIPRPAFLERWHDGSLALGKMQRPAILLTGTPKPTLLEEIP